MAFIRIQREVDESAWLDEVWAEGGALLDLDRKQFLLYGGEEVLYNVPLRRGYLELLAQVWNGWTVRWAYEGIADLADAVGYPRAGVLNQGNQDSTDVDLAPPEQKDWTDLVASVRLEDGAIRLYPLAGDMTSYLAAGPKLTAHLRTDAGLPRLFLGEWTEEFPTGGFHLDLSTQRLDFWVARDAPDLGNRVARAWPGWETRWHWDRYEMQLERTNGLLRLPLLDHLALLDRCREMLLREPTSNPLNTLKWLVEQDRQEGKEVQVNPWAMRNDRLDLSGATRRAILDQAMSRLESGARR